MQVKSIAECFNGSILQYFRPSLSYYLTFRSLFCLFLSGRLRQVLLYYDCGILCFHALKEFNLNLSCNDDCSILQIESEDCLSVFSCSVTTVPDQYLY